MVAGFEAEPRKADRPSRLVPRPRGAPGQRPTRRASAIQKSFAEERETKAADPLKVCATVRMTFCRLVPREPKGVFAPPLSSSAKASSLVGTPLGFFLRKEVIQPQVPLRLPCYDFTPV